MPAIANIPEPTTGYRPVDDAPAPVAPLVLRPALSAHETDRREVREAPIAHAWVAALIAAGLLLRLMMLYFGTLRGVEAADLTYWVGLGEAIMRDPASAGWAWPGFAILANSAELIGLPGWSIVGLGMLVSLLAIPAAYTLGHRATDSPTAGLIAAAALALHPAALTAAGLYGPNAFALALLTLGLAFVAVSPQRGTAAACIGAVLLGLAALTAPLAWAAIPLACVLACKTKHLHTSAIRATAVLALAAAPAVAWHAASGQQPLQSIQQTDAAAASAALQTQHNPVNERLLFAISSHSIASLGQTLHAPINPQGTLSRTISPSFTPSTSPDPVADYFGDGWIVLNLLMFAAGCVGLALLLFRRRWGMSIALALPLAALMIFDPWLGESGRVVMLAMQGTLIGGTFAPRAASLLTDAEKAEREAERLAKQEAKEQARLAKLEKQAKTDLHAFDRRDTQKRGRRASDIERRAAKPDRRASTEPADREAEAPAGRPI